MKNLIGITLFYVGVLGIFLSIIGIIANFINIDGDKMSGEYLLIWIVILLISSSIFGTGLSQNGAKYIAKKIGKI